MSAIEHVLRAMRMSHPAPELAVARDLVLTLGAGDRALSQQAQEGKQRT